MDEMYLTDLIDQPTLQKIQDAFSDMVGMAALTTDSTGHPVTEGSNFTDYCMKYTRKSKVGCARCEECDRYGAVMTGESGRPTSYYCHSGLIDFAAPIMANGRMVGSFIGGQVLSEQPDPEKIRKVAEEIGVDFDEYWEAIKKVKVISKKKIDNATEFLFTIAAVLSDMAMGKYQAIEANKEIAHAAQMKTDFLANMSHEIRTPMNAVIGMAELALRENLPDTAREYINQIKSSGRALLSIINDILDFSKIESGKMDIVPIEYDSMSLFNDVCNIIMTRLVDRDVELILDIDPNLPVLLFGDNIRIRQILINLVNNAVKFTKEGSITIKVRFDKKSDTLGMLRISVIDTGIGIKEEDLGAIFESFSQVDSTRNRNVEGTGLGLAITKRLLYLMNGDMKVTSTYGEGSEFSFYLPQNISDASPAMSVKEPEKKLAYGIFKDKRIIGSFLKDCERLGVKATMLDAETDELYEDIVNSVGDDTEIFIFVDYEMLTDERKAFIESHPNINYIMISDFIDEHNLHVKNLLIVKKPLSSMNLAMIFNKEKISFAANVDVNDGIDFTAPDALVLIVDDNIVNITVAEGLLDPLHLKTVSATSGKEAIKRVREQRFDLILMDHMMPEMDGIMATQIIREENPEYKDIPIIALTANAVSDAREKFLEAGMNDFIAKPIEVRTLMATIKKWLPKDKIHKLTAEESDRIKAEASEKVAGTLSDPKLVELSENSDLDIQSAIKMLGSEALFWSVLKEYYRVIPSKAGSISKHYKEEDWDTYTIEVHALKSASRQVGANELSELAAALEKAGKSGDISFIRANTSKALEMYMVYGGVLAPYFTEEENAKEKCEVDYGELVELMSHFREAMDDLDLDEMESICNRISDYSMPEDEQALYDRLNEACEDMDVDICEEVLDEWEALIQGRG